MGYTKDERKVIEKRMAECANCGCGGVHVDDMDGNIVSGHVEVMVSSADYTLLTTGYADGTRPDLLLCDNCAEAH